MNEKKSEGFSRRAMLKTTMASVGILGIQSLAGEVPCTPAVRTGEGPFYPREKIPVRADLTRVSGKTGSAKGNHIYFLGEVTDSECNPLAGARVEIWQCDARGRYNHPAAGSTGELDPNFQYFAAVESNRAGRFLFHTIKPADYSVGSLRRAPHIHVKAKAKGFHLLTTEMYFVGDETLQANDPVFLSRNAPRRNQLITASRPPTDFSEWGFQLEADRSCFYFPLRLQPQSEKRT